MSTGSEIEVASPKSLAEWKDLAKTLSAANVLPQALKKKPEDIFAICLTGDELGLGPMTSIRGIHIIQGKPTLSADLMGALCMRSRVCEFLNLVESTAEIATYEAKRAKSSRVVTLSFTIAQARRAGLQGDNWRKYPEAMLRARCLAAICRAVFPDLCAGLYDSDSGEIVDVAPVSAPTAQREHVDTVKAALREQIEDAEIIESPRLPKDEALALIAAASTSVELADAQAQLRTIDPADREEIKTAYLARKASFPKE